MAISSGFFRSVSGDRKYTADFFSSYFASFIGNGVFPNPSTNLQALFFQQRTIIIKAGKAWINGHYLVNDADFGIYHDAPSPNLNRIDRIVVGLNNDTREMSIYLKKGTPSLSPTAPTLARNNTVYELALADVLINSNSTVLSQANITDQRLNSELCGLVHGLVQQVDTTTLFNQIQQSLLDFENVQEADFLQWSTDRRSEFETWYAGVMDILDGDVAANLNNKIDDLDSRLTKSINEITYHYSPIMYGALGDYNSITNVGTDDAQAFVDVVNAANGTVIDLMGKTYLISTPIEFENKKIFFQNGKIINGTGALLFTFKTCKVVFENVEIDNRGSTQRCLRFENCINPIIDLCNMYNVVGSDPDLIRFVSCPNVSVTRTKLNGTYGSNSSAAITFQDSPLYILKCHNFFIQNTQISEVYPKEDGDGIKLQSAFYTGTIDSCTFTNCAKRAIKAQINFNNEVYKYIIITNNTIIGGSDYSAIDTQCGNSFIHHNEIIDCESTGISLQEGNNDIRYNRIRSATTITTTSGSAITLSSLGYLNTSSKTSRIEYNDISGTAPFALALRSTMNYQDLVTFKYNNIKLPNARHTVLLANNVLVKEIDISENKMFSVPSNYIRFISKTGTVTTNRLSLINNVYDSLVVNQLNRDVIESLVPTAAFVHVTFSSDYDHIEITGKNGNLVYNYTSSINPSSTPTSNQLNRTTLGSSKIGDYAAKIPRTIDGNGFIEVGWNCIADADTNNPRGLWRLITS